MILSDANGVILDSAQAFYRAFKRTVELFNKRMPYSLEELYSLRRKYKDVKSLLRLFASQGELHYMRKIFGKFMREEGRTVKPYPFVRDALELAERANMKLGIVSNSFSDYVENALGDLREKFEVIICRDHISSRRVDPDGLLLGKAMLKAKYYVGDAPLDFFAAKRAGLKFIGVLSGVADKQTWKELGVDLVFPTYKDVIRAAIDGII